MCWCVCVGVGCEGQEWDGVGSPVVGSRAATCSRCCPPYTTLAGPRASLQNRPQPHATPPSCSANNARPAPTPSPHIAVLASQRCKTLLHPQIHMIPRIPLVSPTLPGTATSTTLWPRRRWCGPRCPRCSHTTAERPPRHRCGAAVVGCSLLLGLPVCGRVGGRGRPVGGSTWHAREPCTATPRVFALACLPRPACTPAAATTQCCCTATAAAASRPPHRPRPPPPDAPVVGDALPCARRPPLSCARDRTLPPPCTYMLPTT